MWIFYHSSFIYPRIDAVRLVQTLIHISWPIMIVIVSFPLTMLKMWIGVIQSIVDSTCCDLDNEKKIEYKWIWIASNKYTSLQFYTRFMPLIEASSNAIFERSSAFPPSTASSWKPIGTIIIPNAVIPNTIIGNIWFRRCLARPLIEHFRIIIRYS